MKILKIALLLITLSNCAQLEHTKKVTVHTFIYPPYTDHGPSGMFIDLISAAYESQGVLVNFELDTLEKTIKKAKRNDDLVLGSRRYKEEFSHEIGFEEFYSVNTNILSIQGREKNLKLGAFSSDEILFAEQNKLTPVKYVTPADGLKLLYDGVVGSIICTDISCDQIKITNPSVQFEMKYGYSFPVDIVYFGKSPSKKVNINISILKAGIQKILANGKYMEIQESYRVSNPIFQIPLEGLLHIKTSD